MAAGRPAEPGEPEPGEPEAGEPETKESGEAREPVETPEQRRARESAERRAVADAHPPVDLTLPVAATVLLAVLLAAVPTLAVDPRAHDGAPWFVATVGVPALAVAVVCDLAMRALVRPRNLTSRFLWWVLLVLPVGALLAGIPGMLAAPGYFSPLGEAIGASALLIVIGMLLGPLLWFFLVMPLGRLVFGVVASLRGREPLWRAFVPGILLLPLGAVIVGGALSLSDLGTGPAGGGAFLAALLGIPGSYEVVSPVGLWIVRGLVVAVVVMWIVLTRRARPRD